MLQLLETGECCISGVGIFVATLLRTLGGRRASRILHSHFLVNILQCPMVFFESTPTGRIVNRFSKDIDAIDTRVPQSAHTLIINILREIGSIVVISMATPLVLTVVAPLLILYSFVQVLIHSFLQRNVFVSFSLSKNTALGLIITLPKLNQIQLI